MIGENLVEMGDLAETGLLQLAEEPKSSQNDPKTPEKCELCSDDTADVLKETKRFYKELNNRLRNVKDYMDQELETGIFTFEMFLMKELETKHAELVAISKLYREREESVANDKDGVVLTNEIKWYRVRERLLDARGAKFGNSLIEVKERVIALRKKVNEGRSTLWKLQEENTRLLSRSKQQPKAAKKREDLAILPEEIASVLPSLSLVLELSPKSVGSLKLRELRQYSDFKSAIRSVQSSLLRTRQSSQTITFSQVAETLPREDYKKVFQTCFETYLRHTLELSTQKVRMFPSTSSNKSSPLMRSQSTTCDSLSYGWFRKASVREVMTMVAARPDVVGGLRKAVFGAPGERKGHKRMLSLG